MASNRLLYKDKRTGKTKRFSYSQAQRLDKTNWEYVPEVKRIIDKDGAEHYKIFMEECVVDVIENVQQKGCKNDNT